MSRAPTPTWKQRAVSIFAAAPTEWLRLSEVFAQIESEIPIHIAMRRESKKCGAADIGLHTARWRYFLSNIGPLIERKSDNVPLKYRIQRTDFVRLLPHPTNLCPSCSGHLYLREWNQQGNNRRKYFCPTCTPAPAPIPTPIPIPEPEPPSPPPPLLLLPKPPKPKPRLNAHQRRGKPKPPKPMPKPIRRELPKHKLVVTDMVPRMNPMPLHRGPIRITVPPPSPLDVTFEDQRNLAGNLKWFLGLPSINFALAELQRLDIPTILAKRGKTMRDFLAKIVMRINFENAQSTTKRR